MSGGIGQRIMKDIHIDSSHLNRALSLFKTDNPTTDILTTSLEGLGAELSNRCMAIGQGRNPREEMREYVMSTQTLSESISYASRRLGDVLIRHEEINWMREILAYKLNSNFNQVSDPKAIAWRQFMGLAVKDFHLDIGSLMDALAPVIIQTKSKLKSKDAERPPGWATIRKDKDTKSTYRQQLSGDLCRIVDSTDCWWLAIKKVRDILAHREHDRIIFENPEYGLLFQVYDKSRSPGILPPTALYRNGQSVVDFDLYSAFVIAEVLALFDDLGNVIADEIQISRSHIAQMSLQAVDKSVAQSIEHLIKATS